MMELQRATTPTSRQSMHTTLYIPGRGILSTADVLLVKHPVGRAPRSLQTLLPEQMAYGVKNVSGEGGTREAMTWATAQEQTTPEKEKKMSFDIVGMNREASRAGHTKPDSHYKHRSEMPMYVNPLQSRRDMINAQKQSPENLRVSGLPSPKDTTNMQGIMSHRYGEIAAEKMKADHELRQKQLEKLIPPHKRRDKNKDYLKKPVHIEEPHKRHGASPREFVGLDVQELWKMPQYQHAQHRVITKRTPEEKARIIAQQQRIYG